MGNVRIQIIMLFSSLSLALAGCGDNECEIDSDCGAEQICADAGGVLFASKVCIADPGGANLPDMSISDMANDVGVPDQGTPPNNQMPDAGVSVDMTIDPDLCEQESNEDFCLRLGKNCGLVESTDNCGVMRTVGCGDCVAPDECSTTNVCGCESESDDTFCDRLGFDCGAVTALDNCDVMRSTNCGTCDGNENCGEQAPNVCGCPCNIGGTCYPEGVANPANTCEICDSSQSTTSWSFRTGSCNDGNPCTENDTCRSQSGTCMGSPKSCPNSGQCREAICDEANGQCVESPITGSCNDGDPCTVNDMCSNGSCAGTPRSCPVGTQCQSSSCNPMTGQCETTNLSGSCNDGDPCTVNDTCSNGSCSGTPRSCPLGTQCQSSSCNPMTGQCETTNLSGPCNDGNPCTEADSCLAGTCQGSQMVCLDPGPCKSASCNPSSGMCETSNDPNGSSCDDGLFCTTTDTCMNGVCDGSARSCNLPGLTCARVCNESADRCEQADPLCVEP